MDPDPTTDPTTTEPPAGDKSFTQADVDRIVAERLARAKTTPPADYEALKAAKEKLDALEAAQQTETEKLQLRAEAAEKAAQAAQERAAGALKRAAVVAAATRAGAVDPDAVFALLDPSAVTVGDDGQVTGVDDAVKALLETKQYLVGKPTTPTPGGADGGPRGKQAGTISREDLKNMTSTEIAEAHKAGHLRHLTSPD